MRKFHLVGRAEFVKNSMGTQCSLFSLVRQDYMGSAEFEWGAVPRFYKRVMQKFDEYKLINLKEKIGLENVNGVPFWAFIRESEMEDFLIAIKSYTDDLKARDKIRSWHLKEWTNMENHLWRDPENNSWNRPSTNFWYCIDPSDRFNVGDWFMFIGAEDRKDAFMQSICFDYMTSWLPQSDEIKNVDYTRR